MIASLRLPKRVPNGGYRRKTADDERPLTEMGISILDTQHTMRFWALYSPFDRQHVTSSERASAQRIRLSSAKPLEELHLVYLGNYQDTNQTGITRQALTFLRCFLKATLFVKPQCNPTTLTIMICSF